MDGIESETNDVLFCDLRYSQNSTVAYILLGTRGTGDNQGGAAEGEAFLYIHEVCLAVGLGFVSKKGGDGLHSGGARRLGQWCR